MEGVRFYAEMQDERGSKSGSRRWKPFTRATLAAGAEEGQRCNVVAIFPGNSRLGDQWDGIGSVLGTSNSPVCSVSPDSGYLRKRCVRVSEALARKLHPRLFATLDAME